MKIQFLGANRQVTGSCYYIEADGARFVVDCGLFQEREFQGRNWDPFPIPIDTVDVMLLTHAHVDHTGRIPLAVRQGFRGRIHATEPTVDLAEIILYDAAKIQVEDAKYKQKRHQRENRKSKFSYDPLYETADVDQAMRLFRGHPYQKEVRLTNRVTATFHEAGHILGSAMIELVVEEGGKKHRIVFSGDIGQKDKPFVEDPSTFDHADTVILESTYGNREHAPREDGRATALAAVKHAVESGGRVVVPAFAVERAQEVLYAIGLWTREGLLPRVPVYLDSPMAIDVTKTFARHADWFDDETRELFLGSDPLRDHIELKLTPSVQDSKAINSLRKPCIVVSSSGMCTGGRIKHHLIQCLPREDCSIVFCGFQAKGTLGRQIVDGAEEVRIHGRTWPVNARIFRVEGMSAHADRSGLLGWMDRFHDIPSRVFLSHGEEEAAESLAAELRQRHPGTEIAVPDYGEVFEIPIG